MKCGERGMDSKRHYRQDGYHEGFADGKRTGGKIKKAYIDNFLKDETQSLPIKDSSEFIEGWHEGFADAVRETLKKMVKKEGLLKNHIYKLD